MRDINILCTRQYVWLCGEIICLYKLTDTFWFTSFPSRYSECQQLEQKLTEHMGGGILKGRPCQSYSSYQVRSNSLHLTALIHPVFLCGFPELLSGVPLL